MICRFTGFVLGGGFWFWNTMAACHFVGLRLVDGYVKSKRKLDSTYLH